MGTPGLSLVIAFEPLRLVLLLDEPGLRKGDELPIEGPHLQIGTSLPQPIGMRRSQCKQRESREGDRDPFHERLLVDLLVVLLEQMAIALGKSGLDIVEDLLAIPILHLAPGTLDSAGAMEATDPTLATGQR